jgi:hypothetical protein
VACSGGELLRSRPAAVKVSGIGIKGNAAYFGGDRRQTAIATIAPGKSRLIPSAPISLWPLTQRHISPPASREDTTRLSSPASPCPAGLAGRECDDGAVRCAPKSHSQPSWRRLGVSRTRRCCTYSDKGRTAAAPQPATVLTLPTATLWAASGRDSLSSVRPCLPVSSLSPAVTTPSPTPVPGLFM